MMEQQLSRLKKRSQQVSRVLSVLHTFTASPLAARILLGCAHNLGSLLCLVGVYVCVLTRWTLQMVATVNSTTADAAARATGQAGMGEHAHAPCSTRSTLQVSKQRLTLWIALLSPI